MSAKKIDVIIPAYNAQNTLFKTLCSIAMQSIVEDIDVTIIDDCSSTGGYERIVDPFRGYLNIRVLRLEVNHGPGFARQYGIDHTGNPFISFVDADDTLIDSCSLQKMRETVMQDNSCHTVQCNFCDSLSDNHEHDTVIKGQQIQVFAKLYRRSFLDKYCIRFNDSRANEDAGFSFLLLLCSTENERVTYLDETVYHRHYCPGSITRREGNLFHYHEGFVGFVDNSIYAIGEALKRDVPLTKVFDLALKVMYQSYFLYVACLVRAPDYAEQGWQCCKRFWREVFSGIADFLPPNLHEKAYMQALSILNYMDDMKVIPKIGIREFLEKIAFEEQTDGAVVPNLEQQPGKEKDQ